MSSICMWWQNSIYYFLQFSLMHNQLDSTSADHDRHLFQSDWPTLTSLKPRHKQCCSVCMSPQTLYYSSFFYETSFEGVHAHTHLHLTETWGGLERPINPYPIQHGVNCPSYTLPQIHNTLQKDSLQNAVTLSGGCGDTFLSAGVIKCCFLLKKTNKVHNGLVLQGKYTYLESTLLKTQSEYNHSCCSVGVKHVCSWCGYGEQSWLKKSPTDFLASRWHCGLNWIASFVCADGNKHEV